MKKLLQLLGGLLLSLPLFGQTVTVTADLKSMFGANQGTKTQVCFTLTDGAGNQLANPRVLGSGVIVPTINQCVSPDGTGHISTSIYANDQISPQGSIYSVTYTFGGRTVHGDIFYFKLSDGTENLNTKIGLTTPPAVPTPTGDTTYARLDGANTPFTGDISLGGHNVLSIGTACWSTDSGITRSAAKSFNMGDCNGSSDGTLTLGTLVGGSGSAASPSIRIGADATGLYQSGAGALDFSVAGVQRMELLSGVLTLFGGTPIVKFGANSGIALSATKQWDFGAGAVGDFTGTVRAASFLAQNVNGGLYVGSQAGQFTSMASCYSSASAGQTCYVTPNWSETFSSQLVMNKNSVGFYFMGAANINTSTFGILISDNVFGAFFDSPMGFGGQPSDTGSGTPVVIKYSGTGDAVACGTLAGSNGCQAFGWRNVAIDISAGTAATGFHGFCMNHANINGMAIVAANSANTNTGFLMDDCATNGNGANTITGLMIGRAKFGARFNGNFRENDFGGMRIYGQVTPIAGSIGVDFEGNSKNNFMHGGFCASGFITAFNFGGTANFNDIHCEEDLDNGGGGAQDAVFASGTFNNEIVRTSDIGAFVFTDNGANNCIRNPGSTCIVRRVDLTGQSANIGSTLLMTIPANSTVSNNGGTYRVSCYAVVTTAATTSSTLPNVQVSWTDFDTGVASAFVNCTPTNTANTVGANSLSSAGAIAGAGDNPTFHAQANSPINYKTVSYTSVGATAMQYALHIKLEYLGQ